MMKLTGTLAGIVSFPYSYSSRVLIDLLNHRKSSILKCGVGLNALYSSNTNSIV